MRPRPQGQIGSRAKMLLKRAHNMMENGDHEQAAQIFERLAEGARDLGRLKIASNLFLQAGRANILSGKSSQGSEFIFTGLNIIAESQKWGGLANIGQRTIDELISLNQIEISKEVSKWLEITLPEPIENYKQRTSTTKPMPLKCPFCGGALRPGEVEMLDNITGECPYCGSAIRAD
jgi:hypothetical protein